MEYLEITNFGIISIVVIFLFKCAHTRGKKNNKDNKEYF